MIITDLLVGPQCPLFDPAQRHGCTNSGSPNGMARKSPRNNAPAPVAGNGTQPMSGVVLLSTAQRLFRGGWILQIENNVFDVGIFFKAGKSHRCLFDKVFRLFQINRQCLDIPDFSVRAELDHRL